MRLARPPFRFPRRLSRWAACCLLFPALCLHTSCGDKPVDRNKPQHIASVGKHAPANGAAAQNPGERKPAAKKTGTQKPYVINGITYTPIASARGYRERGIASWYGEPFHGRRTANNEIYDMHGDTAAHKTLPMNTMLLVRNLDNGRDTVVRVNDRGPFVRERIIDLSRKKAEELGMLSAGTARVEIVALEGKADPSPSAATPAQTRPARPAASPPPKAPTPAKPVPDFDRGNFFVQVGAFERIGEARALARKFARLGRDVVIQQYPAAGMDLYRVLVFAGHSLKAAREYEAKMRASGFRHTLLLAR